MKIHRTLPEEGTQWQADAPSVQAMRIIMPIAALLSAVSLAGGIASFFKLGLLSSFGITLIIGFAIAAWFFDQVAVGSGQSVVRESILGWKKEIEVGVLFWINLALSVLICGVMVFGSFRMSKNGIGYLVLEIRKANEVKTQTDTTLNKTIVSATDQNQGILNAKQAAYDLQVSAINSTYTGKIEALQADIDRRTKQRSKDNYQYIDNKIGILKKQIGEAKAKQGKELATLAAAFAKEQERILAATEDMQAAIIEDAKIASQRQKQRQSEKDLKDKELSGLVSSIFSWSVVLMLVIGLRLTMLETRNGILPNPITTNNDTSGVALAKRFIMALPNYVLSCLTAASEWLYKVAPKHRVPVVDNDIVDFKAASGVVVAIRKEKKEKRKLAAAAQRQIGFKRPGKVGSEKLGSAENLGSEKTGSGELILDNKGSRFSQTKNLGSEKLGSGGDDELSQEERELIQQVKMTKKELTKYKKRQSSSYQKIQAAKAAGEQPKMQQLKAYDNRTRKVEELTAKVNRLESQLNSIK